MNIYHLKNKNKTKSCKYIYKFILLKIIEL